MPTSRQLVTTTVRPLLAAITLAAISSGLALADEPATSLSAPVATCPADTHWSVEHTACVADTHW